MTMEMDTILIGKRIKQVRKMRDMSADALSEKVGIASQTLRHIENGDNKTRLQTLLNIADVLGVSMDYLLGRVHSPNETIISEIKNTYGLTDHQVNMLRHMVENIVPVITSYVEK